MKNIIHVVKIVLMFFTKHLSIQYEDIEPSDLDLLQFLSERRP